MNVFYLVIPHFSLRSTTRFTDREKLSEVIDECIALSPVDVIEVRKLDDKEVRENMAKYTKLPDGKYKLVELKKEAPNFPKTESKPVENKPAETKQAASTTSVVNDLIAKKPEVAAKPQAKTQESEKK